ncbi:MAG TPA: DUF3332 family protein [Candidatus Spyradenecus faecavium]|uniref:DUF3332 family protein n=1 Tax=Candidatus Spyradenecus faecavium TaxID=2840947 RepID=A0A9D1NMW0_9BACT|nr:DUF3332 family protein [Candidatus Spyradenecus faecavium]
MKKMIYGAAAALTLLATGCTGSFQLVQGVHRWHTNFESRWTNEVCYLVACIIPIYAAAYIVDTVFLNSVEFWIGENPIEVKTADATLTRTGADTALVKANATGETYTLRRLGDNAYTVTDAQGNVLQCAVDGDLLTMTAEDGTVRTAIL